MVQSDIERFSAISIDEMTDEVKDNLYSELSSLTNMEDDIPPDRMIHVFRITQEVLKYKGEQVELLVAELDNLAARQGEEEARTHNLVSELEYLRSQSSALDDDKTIDSEHLDTNVTRREIVKLQIMNDQLVSDLQEKENELITEKKEVEKLTMRNATLEEENKSLKGELLATQQELAAQSGTNLQLDSSEQPSVQKYHELMELLRQKNKNISQLLAEIEELEDENSTLKDKFSVVQEEMVEGTEHMSRLSVERINLSSVVKELKDKSMILEQENAGLRSQISELVSEKEIRNKQLDNLSAALDSRVQHWKEILQKKDSEIATLRQHEGNHNMSDLTAQVDTLKQILVKREEEIEELKTQLKQATVDLNESSLLLEQYKSRYRSKSGKVSESNVLKQLRKKLVQAENRISILESKAKHAEEDALRKAEEVTELILQLREFESGTFGLDEAMVRIKELNKQKKVRDKHIEELIQAGNQLQDEASQLEQENLILREKFGIPIGAEIKIEGTESHRSKVQNKMLQLMEELEKSSSEVISLKLENRRLHKQLATYDNTVDGHDKSDTYDNAVDGADRSDTKSVSFDDKDIVDSLNEKSALQVSEVLMVDDETLFNKTLYLQERLKEIIDENEGLRKGMHEILDSIRSQDGSGIVQVESDCLQRLLEALDSRHVNGWYQPAMRLQAQIQLLNGVNNALREELRTYRQKELQSTMELQMANKKMHDLQKTDFTECDGVFEENGTQISDLKNLSAEAKISCSSELEQELDVEKDKRKQLEDEISDMKAKIIFHEEQFIELCSQYDCDKQTWQDLKTTMENDLKLLHESAADDKIKISEYEKHLEILRSGDSSRIEKLTAENTIRICALRTELEQMIRKNNMLQEIESQNRHEKNKLLEEIIDLKSKKDQEIASLKMLNDRQVIEMKKLNQQLDESVDKAVYQNLSNDFDELTLKHREWLHKIFLLKSENENLLTRLERELYDIHNQKREIEVELKHASEQLNYYKTLSNNDPIQDQVAALAEKISTLEVDIINSKQHSDHTNRMYDLMKEQLTESENRCKVLQDRLMEMTEINTESLRLETDLRNKLLNSVSGDEARKFVVKIQTLDEELAALTSQKQQLQNIANIAQEQVRLLEYQRKSTDLDYDSLQRRVLELQSVSDEKVIIDRLTQEVSSFQKIELSSKQDINFLERRIIDMESNLAYAALKLEKAENELGDLKEQDKSKISALVTIIHELQKRFLGSLPLITQELYCQDFIRIKEECASVINELIDMQNVTSTKEPESPISFHSDNKTDNYVNNTQQRLQELNTWMLNEGLKNKVKIYEERLKRQEKLITRLEEEIIHADIQCQEFLLTWGPDRVQIQIEGKKIEQHTQTDEIIQSLISNNEQTSTVQNYADINDIEPKSDQVSVTVNDLNMKLRQSEEDKRELQSKVINIENELRDKICTISSKEKEIEELQKKSYRGISKTDSDEPESMEKLALKATVESLQNIIDQKEGTIKRYQNLLKDSREEHVQNVNSLQKELKRLQSMVDAKEQSYGRLKMRVDSFERGTERNLSIDTYLTRIHELEDDLSQSNDTIARLSNQLAVFNQGMEPVHFTAEERRKTFHESSKSHVTKSVSNEDGKYSSMGFEMKQKDKEIGKLHETIEDLQKKLSYSEKLPGYRDRLKSELERYKKSVEIMQQKENEYKAEIQKLKNQLISRSSNTKRRDVIMTPKEEQLQKKIRELEDRVADLTKQENKWKETRKTKCDEEVDKWQTRKRYQHTIEKLKLQVKENAAQIEGLKLNNERRKDTIIRLEKEKINLENKVKSLKVSSNDSNLIEELQLANGKLEEEIRILRRSANLSAGSTSLTDVIEAQERKIAALQVAKRGDAALAEELERLHERKSQLQKSNIRLEEENGKLRLQVEKLKFNKPQQDETISESDIASGSNGKITDPQYQVKGDKRRIIDLERAVSVLKRVIEKLQIENKKLHSQQVSKVQDKNYAEKLQLDEQKSQENYLNAIEKVSILENELQIANAKIDGLQNLIDRLQSGEELSALKSELAKKTQLLGKVKVLLEKTARREKDLNEKVTYFQNIISTSGIAVENHN